MAPTGVSKATLKAQSAQKANAKGIQAKTQRKIRTSVHFRLPKTLSLARAPKVLRKSIPSATALDAYTIVKFPHNSEASQSQIEAHNTLVFICDVRSNKHQIKLALKSLYDIDASKINTLITPSGVKKAFVRLVPEQDAAAVASNIGLN
ncbi:50S ribosomal protein L23Ae [Fonticula alba]|uniref:50S ribosomal protein L23Ae n=1 Tax=Fonticula alba TaxID=691883 RepID=A0A058ZHT4_FONAL|nr:50S ribosomal protein L23Ae [Fonticula alba]KCV73067.1 50S ribosomal protein L23Ae [Fonticula alba]|eukprot:XP_009492768.1 50S ribosomal protein L23Ae [Fonticula alba]